MYQTIEPPKHLKKYIECFWLGEDELTSTFNTYHSIASCKIELLFFCRGIYASKDRDGNAQNTFKAGFYGHRTGFNHYFSSTYKVKIFGIRFLPLASLTLFNIPANELTNQRIDIDTILGSTATELTEKILEAKTFEQKSTIAIDFFNKRLKSLHLKYRNVENAVSIIQKEKKISIPQLVSKSSLCQRQFERHFKELTGFSAKTYLKLHRFERLIETVTSHHKISENRLIDIALNLGYYDQAHFNHHFKEYTGVKPTAYFTNIALQGY